MAKPITVYELLDTYTNGAGTTIEIRLPREAHSLTIVAAIENYGDCKVVAWRLGLGKRIIIEISN